MNGNCGPICEPPESELSAIIATLRHAEDRLEEMTAGEVDSVSDTDGRTFLLQRAQHELRRGDATTRAAILNALPADIALVDTRGVIVSVNDAWMRSASNGSLSGPSRTVGANCLPAPGTPVSTATALVADGIRAVLSGASDTYSVEYASPSPEEPRWSLMTVTPLTVGKADGAVLMRLDITERKLAEIRVQRLNRGYMMLSQINALIVRAPDRDELFREACRIAVQVGGFSLAWIGTVDVAAGGILPVAAVGANGEFLHALSARKLLADDASLEGEGTSAVAVRTRATTFDNDIAADPRAEGTALHLSRGVRALISVPLIVDDAVVGLFGLHANEAGYFDESELALLDELGRDIAFAIDHIGKAEKINYLAYYDALTGLPNRSLFLDRVGQCLLSAAIAAHRVSLVLMDLERFKSFNDSLGQQAGDDLLRHTAQWLKDNLDDPTQLARIGPDQFAMLVIERDHSGGAARQLDGMIERFHAHDFVHGGTAFRIAAKFGIATFPDDAQEPVRLFTKAESALKNAKASGHRHSFYTQKMTESVARRLSMENQLRRALEQEEFVLHYQPKANLQSGRVTGCEALIRWNSPRTGLVSPAQFIPILEETGMIHEVGRWALCKAIEDYLHWRRAGLPALRIAVNVSPLQLSNPEFTDEIGQLIAIDALAAEGLELEITESMIMADIDLSMQRLRAIREMGIQVAIDDFGTGFSSLAHLSKLPVNTLKIDRSFISAIDESPEGLTLVSTMITLAHSLNLKVVAEGVETEAQSRLLRLLRCDEMQGYLLSKAVPRDEFESRFLSY